MGEKDEKGPDETTKMVDNLYIQHPPGTLSQPSLVTVKSS